MTTELEERAALMAEFLMQVSHDPEPGSPERGSFAWDRLRCKTASTLLWCWEHEPDNAPVPMEGSVLVEIGPAARQSFRRLLKRAHEEVASEVVQEGTMAANDQ